MKRLLNIIGTMDVGGAETMIMKIYRNLDREKFQMDFALLTTRKTYYEDEIVKLGGRIFHLTPKSKNPFKNFKETRTLVENNHYDYVMRTGENAASVLELMAAKKGGATHLIFNSTSSRTMAGTVKEKVVHFLYKRKMRTIPTLKIGCSTSANDFMFGKNSVAKGESIVFNNALDLNDFRFGLTNRMKIRNEFNIKPDEILIGNVGRLSKAKNHYFLLKVFQLIKRKAPKSKLILFGDGELRDPLLKEISSNEEIRDAVIMAGVRNDINACLSALDVFAFPSFYEGLPNALIEAQAVGLPCVVSNQITEEVKLTDNLIFVPIDKGPEIWAETILHNIGNNNEKATEQIKNAGYDIKDEVEKLQQIIFEK